MTRAGLAMVLPDRLYQRGHMLTWPAAQKRALLKAHGIGLVVNVWNKVDPDLSGLAYLNMPMGSDAIPLNTEAVVNVAAHWQGGAVLVMCEAGVTRSVWLCGRVLKALGMHGEDAYLLLHERIPRAKLSTVLKDDLLKG